MKVLGFIIKVITLIYLLLEEVVYYLIKRIDKTIALLGKAIALILPVMIYSVVDNMYNLTPKLTIYVMGLVNTCLNLLNI